MSSVAIFLLFVLAIAYCISMSAACHFLKTGNHSAESTSIQVSRIVLMLIGLCVLTLVISNPALLDPPELPGTKGLRRER